METTQHEAAAVDDAAARAATNLARSRAEVIAHWDAVAAKLAQTPEVVNGWAEVVRFRTTTRPLPQRINGRLITHPHALRTLIQRRLGTLPEQQREQLIEAAQRELAYLERVQVREPLPWDEMSSCGPPDDSIPPSAYTLSKARAEDMLAVCLGPVL